jgi:hypothetical protein
MHLAVTVLYNAAMYGLVVVAFLVLGALVLWVVLKPSWP